MNFKYKVIDAITGNATPANACTYAIQWLDGSTWTSLGGFQNISSATCTASPNFTFTPTNGSQVSIRIISFNNTGDFWSVIDDINVSQIPSPLPVDQGAFEGRCDENGLIELNWNSISENNTSYITVESSKDAVSWETIETKKCTRKLN